jgi:hypothetical protein
LASQASIRASDADREAVAERLRHAAVEGRLEPDELEERLHAALRARTYGDLRSLLSDLPATSLSWERRRGPEMVPVARTALAVAMRVAIALAVVAVVLVVATVLAAGWMLWALVWLGVWGRRSCSARTRWDRTPGPRRGRLAGTR